MSTPESLTKRKINAILKKHEDGIYYYMPVPAGYGKQTVDYLGCFRGHFFAIEAKAPGKKPTPRQEGVLDHVRAAGGRTFEIDGTEKGLRDLEAWLDHIASWPGPLEAQLHELEAARAQ